MTSGNEGDPEHWCSRGEHGKLRWAPEGVGSGVHLNPSEIDIIPYMIHELEMGTESAQWVEWPEKGHPRLCLSGIREMLGET